MVQHVVLEGSDHVMLVLSTEVEQPRRRKRFMYDSRWNQEVKCEEGSELVGREIMMALLVLI